MRTPEERQAEREAQAAAQQQQETSLAQFQPLFDDPTYWGSGAGDYATWDPSAGLQLKMPDGALKTLGHGEHAESDSYLQAAAADPMYDRFIAYADQNEGSLTPEQRQLMTLTGGDTWGQSVNRPWGAIDPYSTGLTGHQAGTMLQTGYGDSLTPEQRQSGSQFNWYESPAQQSARADDGGFLGLGDMAGPLAMMAAMYFLGPAAGALEGAAGAELASVAGEGFGADALFSQAAGYNGLAASAAASSTAPSFLDSLKTGYNTIKPGLDAASNAKKVYDIYGALTQDTAQPATQVGGLQQATQQGGRGAMSQSFGNRNFDAYR